MGVINQIIKTKTKMGVINQIKTKNKMGVINQTKTKTKNT